MDARSLARSMFPAARQGWRWRDALLPVLWIVVVLALALLLELAGWMLFARPLAFVLTPVLLWFWWMQHAGASGLRGWRGTLALVVRLALVTMLIVALAEPRRVRQSNQLSMVFVLDHSASIVPGVTQSALGYLAQVLADKPTKDQAGLVVFGKTPAVEFPPSLAVPLEKPEVTLQIDRGATNLQKALSLAGAVLPEDAPGRLVLLSDGVATEGDVLAAADELKARGIAVDVLPVSYEHAEEVVVERLELPRATKLGESYEAAVIVSSTSAGEGELTLQENGQVIFRQGVSFKAGKNRFAVPLHLREAGYYEYTATLEPASGKDGWKQNNRAVSFMHLQDEGRVLLVVDKQADERDWRSLASVLEQGKRKVEIKDTFEMPSEPLALLPYDCIVFANVPAESFSLQQFEAIRSAVKDQGAGFIMLGGPHSFGPGGYNRTPIEDILPVAMDVSQKKVLPKGALAIILHTCEFPDGNTWAKEITKQAIKVLNDRDEAGALNFDYTGSYKWIFDLTPAGRFSEVARLINNANPGDMPDYGTTMSMALTSLQKSDASAKHVIIISDGDPQPPPASLIKSYIAAGISVSTVAVFPHGNDVGTLQDIAKQTGGRFYYPQNASLLPRIFVKEARTIRRSMIQEKEFTPTVSFPSPVLKGIDAMPPLKGYVITSPKGAPAMMVMKVPDAEDDEPVLSIWRYGTGKTAAFTSDLSPRWAAAWMGWDKYQSFVNQLLTDVARVQKPSQMRMQSYAQGDKGVILIEDYAQTPGFMTMQAQVRAPDGRELPVELRQTGSRRYEGTFDITSEGRYQILAAGKTGERDERLHGGFVLPYSQEFVRVRSNPALLEQIAKRTGGRVLTGTEKGSQVFDVPRQSKRSSRPVFDLFLMWLAILVPLDVAVRRIQIDLQPLRNWLGATRTHKPSDATFTQLMRAKSTATQRLRERTETEAAVTSASAPAPAADLDATVAQMRAEQQRQAKLQAEKAAKAAPDAPSTSRLLAAKRKAREQTDPNTKDSN